MSSDYLWDGSGEPDPEIVRLEQTLRPLRQRASAPRLPGSRRTHRRLLATAAAALVALAGVLGRQTAGSPGGWELAWEGATGAGARARRLAVGEWLETGADRARLSVGAIGQVRLGPRTRVGLRDAGERRHRLSLARGALHATIWAPPGRFLVDTPSAVAVDLGCEYTLEVKEDGSGLLRVQAGWVGFEHAGRQSLVPAGAAAATRLDAGPGTPYYETATEALRSALADFDFGPTGARDAALDAALASARPRDALSLWHLLSRTQGEQSGRVFDRLASLVPPPDGVTRAGIVRGDPALREAWWDELGLGSAEFWRDWTAEWKVHANDRHRSRVLASEPHPPEVK